MLVRGETYIGSRRGGVPADARRWKLEAPEAS
jgi:hypothetical protein